MFKVHSLKLFYNNYMYHKEDVAVPMLFSLKALQTKWKNQSHSIRRKSSFFLHATSYINQYTMFSEEFVLTFIRP